MTEQRRRKRTCIREGCDKRCYHSGARQYCSALCSIIDGELAKTQPVCEAVGLSPRSGELWAAAAALNDAVTEYHRLHWRLSGFDEVFVTAHERDNDV